MEDGHEEGDDDTAYDDTHHDDEDGFDEAGELVNGSADFGVVEVGNLHEHGFECTCFFTDGNHAGHHSGKDFGAGKGVGEGFTVAYAFSSIADGFGVDFVTCGTFYDFECLEDGDTTAGEGAEGTGKATDGNFTHEVTEDGHTQFHGIDVVAARFSFTVYAQECHKSEYDAGSYEPEENGGHGITEVDE